MIEWTPRRKRCYFGEEDLNNAYIGLLLESLLYSVVVLANSTPEALSGV